MERGGVVSDVKADKKYEGSALKRMSPVGMLVAVGIVFGDIVRHMDSDGTGRIGRFFGPSNWSISDAKAYGLDTSVVISETVPLIINTSSARHIVREP